MIAANARMRPPGQAAAARIVVRVAIQEAIRRRVLLVVAALTAAFLVLYAIGVHFAFEEVGELDSGPADLEDRTLTGATVIGLGMFATLFLGAILATFLTMGVVRGDAETGMLQPLVARPPSRTTIMLARMVGAAAISAAYVVLVYAITLAITSLLGDWSPDRPLVVAALLAFAVVVVGFISLLASVWLSSTAQGIAVLMVYGGGLTAGLLGQIGDGLGSATLMDIAEVVSWALPFEALYQSAIHALTADTGGFTENVITLGPFGGGNEGGPGLVLWSLAYLAAVAWVAVWGFRRRDL